MSENADEHGPQNGTNSSDAQTDPVAEVREHLEKALEGLARLREILPRPDHSSGW